MASRYDSTDLVICQTSFYGGQGSDKKVGIKNAYADSECLDARLEPSAMSVLAETSIIRKTAELGLVTGMTQSADGMKWMITDHGKLIKVDRANVATVIANVWTDSVSRADIAYQNMNDTLYITANNRLYSYDKVMSDNLDSRVVVHSLNYSTSNTVAQMLVRSPAGYLTGNGVDRWSFKVDGAGSTAVKTSLSENDDDKCVFIPDVSPMAKIAVGVRNHPASGEMTLILHNNANKEIARAKASVSDIQADGTINFTFIKPIEIVTYKTGGTEYHIHLIADTNDWTVDTYESGKMYGLHFRYYANALNVTSSGYHPIMAYKDGTLLVGNGRYLMQWLPTGAEAETPEVMQSNRVSAVDGMEITSLTSSDEYIVMGCERVGKGQSKDFQQGSLCFWDCVADNVNFRVDLEAGAPQSLYSHQNIIYMVIDNALYVYTGSKAIAKIRTLTSDLGEFSGVDNQTVVYDHAMTVRKGILLLAYPGKTTLNTRAGVYSYGSLDKNYPNSYYYSYALPGLPDNCNTDKYSFEVGGIWNFGENLYISHRVHDNIKNSDTWYITVVNNSSKPAKRFKYESLEYDGSYPWKAKELLRMVATFDPLPQGCTIRLKYKIDGRPWVLSEGKAKAGSTELYFEVNKRFKVLQFGLDGVNDGATKPARITSIGVNIRSLPEEGKMHK